MDIARRLHVSPTTVCKWRTRFLRDRVDGLADDPRLGTPRRIIASVRTANPGCTRHMTSFMKHCYRTLGCRHDVEKRVETHLFGIAPNNSGSAFLKAALATCRATWNLYREGQAALGYVGPKPSRDLLPSRPATLIWASEQRWIDLLTDPRHYDWPRTRKAWYFQAFALSPDASVFYSKTPCHLLLVDELARHFRNAKFLFMVRNPYAVCEGICRHYRREQPFPCWRRSPRVPNLLETAARHVVTCLEWQRRNLQTHGDRGVFFTYETMCAEPERTAQAIRALVPELDDLNLRQRLPVKGEYHEMLTDMNARQIARLGAEEFAAFNRVFRKREDILAWFGYCIMEGAG